jgi:DNA-binding MarR family transcriptional regulator
MKSTSRKHQDREDLALRFMRVIEEAFKRMALQQKNHPFKELNLNQIRALHLLHHHPGQLQKELAEELGITPAAVSAIVRQMQVVSLVERRIDVDDARSMRLYLSEEAQCMIAENQQIRRKAVGDLLAGLPLNEQRMVVEALERSLNVNVHDQTSGTAPNP